MAIRLYSSLILLFLVASSSATAQTVNETPHTATAVLFEPCAWELHSTTGPLKALAASQHYDYTEYQNTTGTRPEGTEAATLDAFAGFSDVGILDIEGHGGPNGFMVECYRVNEAAQRDARFKRLCDGTDMVGGIKLKCPDDLEKNFGTRVERDASGREHTVGTNNGIYLKKSGIQKLYHPQDHTILFAGMCNSMTLRPSFMSANIEYLGVLDKCKTKDSISDTKLIYRRLSGVDLDGHARPVGGHNQILRPNGTCTAFGYGGLTEVIGHAGPGNTTVAPAVLYSGATRLGGCKNGRYSFDPDKQTFPEPFSYQGTVVFDTTMDTSIDPMTVIATDGGCASIIPFADWIDDHSLEFYLFWQLAGTMHPRVNNATALSANNARELDGNVNPAARPGVGPNRDNYNATDTCVPFATAPAPKYKVSNPSQPGINAVGVSVVQQPVGPPDNFATGVMEVSSSIDVSEITFSSTLLIHSSGQVIPVSQVLFEPPLLTDMPAGDVTQVGIKVSVNSFLPTGPYNGWITVTDNFNNVAQAPITVYVEHPPVLNLLNTFNAEYNQTTIISFSFSQPDGLPVALSVDVLPEGAEVSYWDNGTGQIVFTPLPEMADSVIPISIVAYDDDVVGGTPAQVSRTVEAKVTRPRGFRRPQEYAPIP